MGLPDPPTPLFKPLIWTSFNIIWKSHVWKSHSLLEHAWSKSSSTGQFNWPMAIEPQRPNPMEVITPWPHMPNLIQLVQGTEHGSVSDLIADLIAFCP